MSPSRKAAHPRSSRNQRKKNNSRLPTPARPDRSQLGKPADQTLHESEDKYRTIYEGSPEGVCVADPATKTFHHANPAMCRMFGYTEQELLELKVDQIHPREHLRRAIKEFEAQARGEKFIAKEIPCLRKDGSVFYADIRSTPLRMAGRRMVAGFFSDVTDRKRTEEALRQSEEQYRTLAETARDFIYIIDRDDRVDFVNGFAAARLGVRPQDLVGKPRSRLFTPAEAERQKMNLDKVFKTGEMVAVEAQTLFPDGPIWLHTQLVPLRDIDGRVSKVLGISRDVTSLKDSEEALRKIEEAHLDQMRRLARESERLLEEERASVSRHLHDGVGQSLTSLMMRLAWAERRGRTSDPALGDELKQACEQAAQMIDDIRRVARSLRPVAIEHDGLISSIRSYTAEFQRLSGITCRMFVRPEDLVVKEPSATAIFRIIQEAMTNITRHARASRCGIRLKASNDQIELRVQDNGRGAKSDALEGHQSLGILGMKERASAVGGCLRVQNGPKGGVLVRGCFPVHDGNT